MGEVGYCTHSEVSLHHHIPGSGSMVTLGDMGVAQLPSFLWPLHLGALPLTSAHGRLAVAISCVSAFPQKKQCQWVSSASSRGLQQSGEGWVPMCALT